MKPTLILLIAGVALAACAGAASSNPTLRPGEDLIPTPTSALIDGFVWQTDGLFGYRMLRPANWEPVNSIDSREYGTPGFRDQADRIVLRAVNLQAYYKSGTTANGSIIVALFAFEQDPSLEGWTAGVEQNWKSLGIESSLLRTLPQAKIYSVKSPGASDILLVAWAVDENQPLAMGLTASGVYADLERLQKEGILEDLATMVASAQAIPQDPQNVDPPLTEQESSALVPSPAFSTPAVQKTMLPPTTMTPTPACVPVAGVDLDVVPLSTSAIHVKVTGLNANEHVTIVLHSEAAGQTFRIESGSPVAAGENGSLEYTQDGLVDRTSGTSFKDWQIQVIHSRGVACTTVSLP